MDPAATQYELSPPPGDAVSAVAFAPVSPTKLLVASWDKKVYSYDVSGGADENSLSNTYEFRAPVLDVCFGADDNEAFTGTVDWGVNRYVWPPIRTLSLYHVRLTEVDWTWRPER